MTVCSGWISPAAAFWLDWSGGPLASAMVEPVIPKDAAISKKAFITRSLPAP
jgi:hypothetical protein